MVHGLSIRRRHATYSRCYAGLTSPDFNLSRVTSRRDKARLRTMLASPPAFAWQRTAANARYSSGSAKKGPRAPFGASIAM